MSDSKSPTNHHTRKAVYTVVERDGGARARWIRVGIAFVNRDGSLNVILDALPVSGTLHIRDFSPREEEGGAAVPAAA